MAKILAIGHDPGFFQRYSVVQSAEFQISTSTSSSSSSSSDSDSSFYYSSDDSMDSFFHNTLTMEPKDHHHETLLHDDSKAAAAAMDTTDQLPQPTQISEKHSAQSEVVLPHSSHSPQSDKSKCDDDAMVVEDNNETAKGLDHEMEQLDSKKPTSDHYDDQDNSQVVVVVPENKVACGVLSNGCHALPRRRVPIIRDFPILPIPQYDAEESVSSPQYDSEHDEDNAMVAEDDDDETAKGLDHAMEQIESKKTSSDHYDDQDNSQVVIVPENKVVSGVLSNGYHALPRRRVPIIRDFPIPSFPQYDSEDSVSSRQYDSEYNEDNAMVGEDDDDETAMKQQMIQWEKTTEEAALKLSAGTRRRTTTTRSLRILEKKHDSVVTEEFPRRSARIKEKMLAAMAAATTSKTCMKKSGKKKSRRRN